MQMAMLQEALLGKCRRSTGGAVLDIILGMIVLLVLLRILPANGACFIAEISASHGVALDLC